MDYTGYECEELINILLVDILIPLIAVEQRIDYLGITILWELLVDSNVSVQKDECGVATYTFSLYLNHEKNNSQVYIFSFCYGNYNAWNQYISNMEKDLFTKVFSNPFFNLAVTVGSAFLNPVAGVIVGTTMVGLSSRASADKTFAVSSRNVLNSAKTYSNNYSKSLFGYLDVVVYTIMNVGIFTSRTLYKGDESIYAIAI